MYVNPTNKKNFISILLLDKMIEQGYKFKTILNGDDKLLEDFLVELMAKGYLTTSGIYYQPTQKGIEAYQLFAKKRFQEYLKFYDIFSFVDLTAGEFAFASYFDFDTDEQWNEFKSNDRFEDLRVAVAIYKKNIDPAEIVFMSFLDTGRFDTVSIGWQMDLLSDQIWNEIEAVCASNLKPEQLGTPDVIEDIIKQGADLMMKLLQEENNRKAAQAEQQRQSQSYNDDGDVEEEVIEETIVEYETVEYYEPYYYDPFYVSPIWLVPLFLW